MTDAIFPLPKLLSPSTGPGIRPELPDASHYELFVVRQRERTTSRLAALGEMTGGIAHDFRNLLAVIEAGLRLADKRADEPESVHAYVTAAREAISRGIELTSQLLAFAKHQDLDLHAGSLNEFLHCFEPFLRYGAGPDVRIRLELGSDLPACLVDPAQFDAAILNLIINARDAMPKGGEIRIITERWEQNTTASGLPERQTYARVRVEDDGCGMSEEILERIFDPFFTTKGETGTGLGLPQVRAFVEMVGGQISVASKRAAGTTVVLLFPSVHMGDFQASPIDLESHKSA